MREFSYSILFLNLKQEVVQSRSIASKAAAEALEEALATESIIRNLR